MSCAICQHWTVQRVTTYDDGSIVERWKAPEGVGHCELLGIATDPGFGCNRFIESFYDHVETLKKPGAPWQHFVMIPCPDCAGKGDGGRGHRCAGTGLVRLYDDGHIGDEQTRRHPKENRPAALCHGCNAAVDPNWAHCPACGVKLWKVAETEVIKDDLGPLPPGEGRGDGP